MNLNRAAGQALVAALKAGLRADQKVEVAVCPPFPYLFPIAEAVAGSPIRLGAQNLWPEEKGAFTGEVSPGMLRDAGCTYVILGHSERRHTIGPARSGGGVHGEDDALINRKVRAAFAAGMVPILCIGETLAERDAGQTEAVLTKQLDGGLTGLSAQQVSSMVIAYEPVWAIGTGRNATPQQAADAHRHVRHQVGSRFGTQAAEAVRIQYGGSVKASNAKELMAIPDVDGALVGGASLVADDFLGIITGCIQAKG